MCNAAYANLCTTGLPLHDIKIPPSKFSASKYTVTKQTKQVGGINQWLRCRSLAGGLSLPCAQSMADRWPCCEYTVHYGSANQANLAFHPSGFSKWVLIHLFPWVTKVKTIKRQTRATYDCMATGQSPWPSTPTVLVTVTISHDYTDKQRSPTFSWAKSDSNEPLLDACKSDAFFVTIWHNTASRKIAAVANNKQKKSYVSLEICPEKNILFYKMMQ